MKTTKTLALMAAGLTLMGCQTEKRYFVLERDPLSPTAIPRTVISGEIPIDKSWGELTPAMQQRIRLQYEQMGDGDEPPYPEGGTQTLMVPTQQAAKLIARRDYSRVSGRLDMLAMIDRHGLAQQVTTFQKPSDEIEAVARAVLFKAKFKPALCKGTPCEQEFRLRITFE